MKKYSLTANKLIALLCCLIMALSIVGCSDKDNSGDTTASSSPAKQAQSTAKATPAPSDTQTNDKATAQTTSGSGNEATQEPTEAPKPTSGVQLNENLPDYYFDFTVNGYDSDTLVSDYLIHCLIEDVTETGTRFIMDEAALFDPYFFFVPDTMPFDDLSIPTYDYIAIRVRASRSDLQAQIRYDTDERNRGEFWYLINFEYNDTTEWQTLVGKFTDTLYVDAPEVLNGTLKMIRFDLFDDKFDEPHDADTAVKADDWCEIESIAFFKTEEEANAYTGLYKAN